MEIRIVKVEPGNTQYNYFAAFICGVPNTMPQCLVTLSGEQAVRDWLKNNSYYSNPPLVSWDCIR